jgi:ADP-heptose:LPS heptosyltransferase
VGGSTPETASLLSHEYATRPGEHAVEQALGIARVALQACGTSASAVAVKPGIIFRVSEEARAEADAWLLARSLGDGERVVAIHPAAGAGLKSWPAERWGQVAERVPASIVLSGAPGDEPWLRCIQQHTRRMAHVACGQRLEVSAALFERCAVVMAPDSGAAHVAAAVGTPTVRLYGPASQQVFGPWPPRHDQRVLSTTDLACVPCGHMVDPPCGAREMPACMLALGTDAVVAAVSQLLAETEN